MIKRPDSLEMIEVDLSFNSSPFHFVEVDLLHINKNNRSTITTAEIWEVVVLQIAGLEIRPVDSKQYANGYCDYFALEIRKKGIRSKLVWCVCSDKPSTIGVITYYRF